MSKHTLNVWNERGSISIHVENDDTGIIVWAATNNRDDQDEYDTGSFWPVEDGFMDHIKDKDGLTDYLRSVNIFTDDDYIAKVI